MSIKLKNNPNLSFNNKSVFENMKFPSSTTTFSRKSEDVTNILEKAVLQNTDTTKTLKNIKDALNSMTMEEVSESKNLPESVEILNTKPCYISIITNTQLKQFLDKLTPMDKPTKDDDTKDDDVKVTNRVSKMVYKSVNEYFIDKIIPEVVSMVTLDSGKLCLPTEIKNLSNGKILPTSKFIDIFQTYLKKVYPHITLKLSKEKENLLKLQLYSEDKLLKLIKCAQICKEHGGRKTLLISDWYLAIKKF